MSRELLTVSAVIRTPFSIGWPPEPAPRLSSDPASGVFAFAPPGAYHISAVPALCSAQRSLGRIDPSWLAYLAAEHDSYNCRPGLSGRSTSPVADIQHIPVRAPCPAAGSNEPANAKFM